LQTTSETFTLYNQDRVAAAILAIQDIPNLTLSTGTAFNFNESIAHDYKEPNLIFHNLLSMPSTERYTQTDATITLPLPFVHYQKGMCYHLKDYGNRILPLNFTTS
jgi:hypothetical protein